MNSNPVSSDIDEEFEVSEREKEKEAFEHIESEEEDQEAEQATYEILTYPADFTLEVLADKFERKQIQIPPYQRGFVWSQEKSSRLIESFLLGLPVPPIYLYQDPVENLLLVIDGQQRLKSIAYFFEGYFGEEKKGKRPIFRLKALNEKSVYLNKTYEDLENEDPASYNKLNDSTLRAFVVKQLNPKDNTSVFHIFERLNTGGALLKGQEIRNCIYHGLFNDLLNELNDNSNWRNVFGVPTPQKHKRDVELILRFFALYYNSSAYKKSMKDFLSTFMKAHQNPDDKELKEYRILFERTTSAVRDNLGDKPFHIRVGLNAAVCDAVFVAFAKNLENIPNNVKKRYQKLLKDKRFEECITSHTTDTDVVSKRLKLTCDVLFR